MYLVPVVRFQEEDLGRSQKLLLVCMFSCCCSYLNPKFYVGPALAVIYTGSCLGGTPEAQELLKTHSEQEAPATLVKNCAVSSSTGAR